MNSDELFKTKPDIARDAAKDSSRTARIVCKVYAHSEHSLHTFVANKFMSHALRNDEYFDETIYSYNANAIRGYLRPQLENAPFQKHVNITVAYLLTIPDLSIHDVPFAADVSRCLVSL